MAIINTNNTNFSQCAVSSTTSPTITNTAPTSFTIPTIIDNPQINILNKAVVFMLDYLTGEINNKENPTDKDTYTLSVLMDLYSKLMEYEKHE